MAFKAPSFHDLYYFRKNFFYGNPALEPEGAVTGEGQIIYRQPGVVDIRVTGFYTRINNLIGYARRDKARPLESPDSFPASQRPDGSADYRQKANLEYATTAGVEAEAWVQPHRRILIQASGTYRVPRDHEGKRLNYSSEWTAGGALTLRILENLQATLRGLGVGSRPVPRQALTATGFPGWTADLDPTLGAPAYFVASFVLGVGGLFGKRLTATLKLDNVTNADCYDAGLDVLYPQRRFQGMIWLGAGL
jgi:outer membrane receptor for ferrienterochelin and colicin